MGCQIERRAKEKEGRRRRKKDNRKAVQTDAAGSEKGRNDNQTQKGAKQGGNLIII